MKPKRPTQRDPNKVAFSVALPKVLVWQIEEIAQTEHRSRNGQIEHFLAEAVAQWKREHPQDHGHVAEDQAPYDATPASDPAAQALRVRAAQPTPPPTAPQRTLPEAGKGKL